MNQFVVVDALAFRRGKVNIRLRVVGRQFSGREIARRESSWVGILGIEIITELGVEGFGTYKAGVNVGRNIEAKDRGVDLNAIGKGRVNCLESSSSGSGKDGHGRNNSYVALVLENRVANLVAFQNVWF
jgi:hypothetical protein